MHPHFLDPIGALGNLKLNKEFVVIPLTLMFVYIFFLIGFLVALELKIIKVKPYVHMKYIPVKGQSEYCQMMRDLSGAYDKNAKTPDYLEATVYNKNEVSIDCVLYLNQIFFFSIANYP